MSEEMKQSFPNSTCPYCGMNMKSGDGSWWCTNKTCPINWREGTAQTGEAKSASAVVNPYPHNSKERDLFNEGFFAGYLKDSEAEKYRRLVEAAEKFFAIQFPVNCIHDSEPWFCDGCKVVWEHAIGEAKVALRSALDALKEGK